MTHFSLNHMTGVFFKFDPTFLKQLQCFYSTLFWISSSTIISIYLALYEVKFQHFMWLSKPSPFPLLKRFPNLRFRIQIFYEIISVNQEAKLLQSLVSSLHMLIILDCGFRWNILRKVTLVLRNWYALKWDFQIDWILPKCHHYTCKFCLIWN